MSVLGVRLRQRGGMWTRPGGRPMRFEALQDIDVRAGGLPLAGPLRRRPAAAAGRRGRPRRRCGPPRGPPRGRAPFRSEAPEVDRGQAMRYLAELAWAPPRPRRTPPSSGRRLDPCDADVATPTAGGRAAVRLRLRPLRRPARPPRPRTARGPHGDRSVPTPVAGRPSRDHAEPRRPARAPPGGGRRGSSRRGPSSTGRPRSPPWRSSPGLRSWKRESASDALGDRGLALGGRPPVALGVGRRARVVPPAAGGLGAARLQGDRGARPRGPAPRPHVPASSAARPRPGARRRGARLVAAAAQRDQAAVAGLVGQRAQPRPELAVERHRGEQVAQRVGVVVVDAALGHDRVRREGAHDGRDDPVPRRPVGVVAGEGRQGDVGRATPARSAPPVSAGKPEPGNRWRPLSWTETVRTRGLVVVDPLGAVAVVDVEVDVGDPLEPGVAAAPAPRRRSRCRCRSPGPGRPSRGGRRPDGTSAARARPPATAPAAAAQAAQARAESSCMPGVGVVVAADAPLARLGLGGEHGRRAVAAHGPDEGRREHPRERLVGERARGAGSSATPGASSRPASRHSATARRWRRASVGWSPPKRIPRSSSWTTSRRSGPPPTTGRGPRARPSQVEDDDGQRPRPAAMPYHSQAGSRRGGRHHGLTRTTRIARSSASGPPWKATTAPARRPRAISLGGDPPSPAEQRPQALLAEHLAVAARLGDAVGVEHQRVARAQLGRRVVHAHLGERAQQGARARRAPRPRPRRRSTSGRGWPALATVTADPAGPRARGARRRRSRSAARGRARRRSPR